MTWLAWRQFRTQAAVTYAAAAVLIVLLAVTAPHLENQYHADGAAGFLNNLAGPDELLYVLGSLGVLAVPPLIGMFWGAPLITRELEAGTHRLAWTQTVTRGRWAAVKIGLGCLAAMAVSGVASLALTWWARPVDSAIATISGEGRLGPGPFIFPRLAPEMFAARGLAPIGYAAFAFVLGAILGVIVRSTLPAMLISLAGFVVTQVVMTVWVRPGLFPPMQVTEKITGANLLRINNSGGVSVALSKPGAWITGEQTIGASGHPVAAPSWISNCLLGPGKSDPSCFARLAGDGYRQLISYQPASRFWELQGAETLIYLVAALALAVACTWWIRRRLT